MITILEQKALENAVQGYAVLLADGEIDKGQTTAPDGVQNSRLLASAHAVEDTVRRCGEVPSAPWS